MTRQQVFNEHIQIVPRETIGRGVCSLYLAQPKTLDWESRMRWSVILVSLLSLLFLSRNAALQISTLHCVDTMSNPAPHFKAKSHTSYISLFQSAIIVSTRTWVAKIFSSCLQLLDSLWSCRFCTAHCSWEEQNNSSLLTVSFSEWDIIVLSFFSLSFDLIIEGVITLDWSVLKRHVLYSKHSELWHQM